MEGVLLGGANEVFILSLSRRGQVLVKILAISHREELGSGRGGVCRSTTISSHNAWLAWLEVVEVRLERRRCDMENVLGSRVQEWSTKDIARVFPRIFAIVLPRISKHRRRCRGEFIFSRSYFMNGFDNSTLGNTAVIPTQQPRISTTTIASTAAPS